MTNTLRTRIAAAIESIRIQRDGENAVQMADAVIRELLMRQEAAFGSQSGQLIAHRYVTKWETDASR